MRTFIFMVGFILICSLGFTKSFAEKEKPVLVVVPAAGTPKQYNLVKPNEEQLKKIKNGECFCKLSYFKDENGEEITICQCP